MFSCRLFFKKLLHVHFIHMVWCLLSSLLIDLFFVAVKVNLNLLLVLLYFSMHLSLPPAVCPLYYCNVYALLQFLHHLYHVQRSRSTLFLSFFYFCLFSHRNVLDHPSNSKTRQRQCLRHRGGIVAHSSLQDCFNSATLESFPVSQSDSSQDFD